MDNRDSIIGALDDGNGNYIAQKIPFPNIFEGSAIIDIKASGICGSDLHMTNERNEPQSIPSGHETAGEIIELPKSYSGNLNIGDRVAIDSIGAGKACGSCYFCNYGQFRHCMNQSLETGGGFSQFITRKPKGLFKISDQNINELEIPTGNPLIVELDNNLEIKKYYYLDESRAKNIIFNQ